MFDEEYLVFYFKSQKYMLHTQLADGFFLSIHRGDFQRIVASVKQQCTNAAEGLISELRRRFSAHEVMNACGIIYPQYWLRVDVDVLFPLHVNILEAVLCVAKPVGGDGRCMAPLLDGQALDMQSSSFKLTMVHNAEDVLAEQNDLNPVTRIWRKVAASTILAHKLSEFMKLVELAVVQILDSTEDERTFSNLSFMKNKLRNRLTTHLDLCVRVFSQKFFTLANFSYEEAISSWKKQKVRYALED